MGRLSGCFMGAGYLSISQHLRALFNFGGEFIRQSS